jgi:hypothetical protein
MLESLSYKDLTIDEFGQSNIPDNNLFSTWVAGVSPREVKYTFVFIPERSWGGGYPYIKVDGERKQVSEKPERYEAGSSGIVGVLNDLQEIVEGNKEVSQCSSNSDRNDTGFIRNPKTKMTQKEIAEVARHIDNKLRFGGVTIQYAYYRNVVPLNPSLGNLGFNLPPQKIFGKSWEKEKTKVER